MPTLDWRDRPKASPLGGFLIQSRAGATGNFDVVIPWPDGGLAHFSRDNDAAGFPWHGPVLFGSDRCVGVSVTESDSASVAGQTTKSLEVAAVGEDGTVTHWWRENGGNYAWHKAETITTGGIGVPAIAYTGALFKEGASDVDRHDVSELHLVVPAWGGGLKYLKHHDQSGPQPWQDVGGPPSRLNFVGAGLVLTPLSNDGFKATWKDLREFDPHLLRGYLIAAAVSDDGGLMIYAFDERYTFGAVTGDVNAPTEIWGDSESLMVPTGAGQEVHAFRGRPSMVHGDYDLDDTDSPGSAAYDLHFGNLELVAPARNGGIHHFWRDNGKPNDTPHLKEGWRFATTIGSILYDEVSLIQSNFGHTDHGNLELVARTKDQRGFDFYWRGEDSIWHGPTPVTADAVAAPASSPPEVDPGQLEFVHWTSAGPDGAGGTLRGEPVTLSGPMGTAFFLHDNYAKFDTSAFTPPLAATGMVEMVGGPGHTFRLTFGSAVRDPILHLGSLASVLTFSDGGPVVRLSGDAGFGVAGSAVTGTLGPTDSNGSVRLAGAVTDIMFTLVPNFADGTVPDGVFLQVGGARP
jgi:hypothetical protein